MHYCGVVSLQDLLQLVVLQEVRTPEPPIRLGALFFEPGTAEQVAAELGALSDVVVGVGGPLKPSGDDAGPRLCDTLLARLGVPPQRPSGELMRLAGLLDGTRPFRPDSDDERGAVGEGAYRAFALFETTADGAFCALQGRRLPAKRHPVGMQMRIDELAGDHVMDESGDLWQRRVEEIDAAGCALCAHRYAVGHASWLGRPDEGVVVLPGSSLPDEFPRRGVLPPVERLQLPPVTRA